MRSHVFSRRQFLKQSAFAAAALSTPGLFAEELTRTPRIGEGPFYPDKLPLDTDNDLLIINDKITPAVGQIAHLGGRILSATGEPIRNAVVEIWQVDAKGAYIHSQSGNRERRDANFQGFGRFLTGSKGEYYFRTIKPVAYPGRTPHIHFAVYQGGKRMLTTQMMIQGETANKKDFLYNRLRYEKAQKAVLAKFERIKGSKIGELAASFDLVIGKTPEAPERRRPPGRRQSQQR
ncbi:MAG: intradiol ring-cleavage dioxygenase [Planctomycetaceae bacterium]|nr:intradiol ring-cleavage dioxygenase [Planctomycetaceae bacterium]